MMQLQCRIEMTGVGQSSAGHEGWWNNWPEDDACMVTASLYLPRQGGSLPQSSPRVLKETQELFVFLREDTFSLDFYLLDAQCYTIKSSGCEENMSGNIPARCTGTSLANERLFFTGEMCPRWELCVKWVRLMLTGTRRRWRRAETARNEQGEEQRSCQEEQEKANREGWPTSPGHTHTHTHRESVWLAGECVDCVICLDGCFL